MVKRRLQAQKQATPLPVQPIRQLRKDSLREQNHNLSSFEKYVGFSISELKTWERFVKLLFKPTDPSSLGVVRALFGLLMVLDIPEERGLADADIRWGNPDECRFPLFSNLHPLPLEWMCIIYLIMWIGAFGIMLGFHFKKSCVAFILPYFYIFLLDKATWNNHTYLYGLIALLLLGSNANHYWSLDAVFCKVKYDSPVPLWNYAILRVQLFIVYFIAGLKKMDQDWIEGYSMTNLNNHWVFDPFKLLLTPEQVDYWIVHVSGFLLDLTIGFWLFFDKTRPYAIFFCTTFHLMNSTIFSIGMFPYVCLATMPIFCYPDWPKTCNLNIKKLLWSRSLSKTKLEEKKLKNFKSHQQSAVPAQTLSLTWKHSFVATLLISYTGLQVFLPYSHFITKGYNNWTNGLYGYSWDMMVHSWDTIMIALRIVDNTSGKEHFLDPEAWVQTDRWAKHADMVVQYAHCLKRNILSYKNSHVPGTEIDKYITGDNISIYVDVWCSLNGRFQQRMFDPNVDILRVEWSPFEKPSWLMPLLTEFSSWRQRIMEMEKEVYSWSDYSDALFVADFPGLYLENFIAKDLSNVTLTILEGEVFVNVTTERKNISTSHFLTRGEAIRIPVGVFHKVLVVSSTPACYMYTYTNYTKQLLEEADQSENVEMPNPNNDFFSDLKSQIKTFLTALGMIFNAILSLLFSVPMPRRVKVA
ncbi:vitamin K-dependent gamma-carboxylase isoform X1 [Schistocerca cancellata]|uniref:vitamin K-dependent gamma-carboxylase isoform X1 n=1 Tax=Schistocerca cancellata TaxID=274614 RepID=UPI002118203E|nr:vitamin K-dependent gamma-carboxylase isoform X1 [Schistocerca cancellata]